VVSRITSSIPNGHIIGRLTNEFIDNATRILGDHGAGTYGIRLMRAYMSQKRLRLFQGGAYQPARTKHICSLSEIASEITPFDESSTKSRGQTAREKRSRQRYLGSGRTGAADAILLWDRSLAIGNRTAEENAGRSPDDICEDDLRPAAQTIVDPQDRYSPHSRTHRLWLRHAPDQKSATVFRHRSRPRARTAKKACLIKQHGMALLCDGVCQRLSI